jgi:hypothetical protein
MKFTINGNDPKAKEKLKATLLLFPHCEIKALEFNAKNYGRVYGACEVNKETIGYKYFEYEADGEWFKDGIIGSTIFEIIVE